LIRIGVAMPTPADAVMLLTAASVAALICAKRERERGMPRSCTMTRKQIKKDDRDKIID